jgi:hypothetical protein
MHQVAVGLKEGDTYLDAVRLNIVRTSSIIGCLHHMTSKRDHTVIETRNMSAETRLQTVSGNTHEREGRGVSFNPRRSELLLQNSTGRQIVGDAYVSTRDNQT